MAVEITEVRIKLMEETGERLQAFCSITFDDCFVIRDLKIIEGANGPFVAMPSRKLTAHCPQCGCKNHLKAPHCNQCGARLKEDRAVKDEEGRTKLYADIAHPINSACREMIQDRVIREFHDELERAKLPGYMSRYDDFDHEEAFAQPHRTPQTQRAAKPQRRDSPSHRPPERDGHQHVYVRPGSEPASQIQPAEQQPRPPHKVAAQQPAPSIPSAPAAASRDGAASDIPPKTEGFGAGIF
jgi:stage V sporulation protein G